ncbi:hypothetical protein SLEP1_g41132 [Rubroshorea leprosula]|uniref:Uncharacterized protein n=1 Tax=Rubroshorea leprosula TaxID=152421 RepID=A0AAV5HDX5_9ROSI|nr:hypothetical protein SLEP1_g1480 [Rubroshorea leprosula]GKV32536.1 hypothetical protein SLEP1_g41132 [Rubroshorea leprosula]
MPLFPGTGGVSLPRQTLIIHFPVTVAVSLSQDQTASIVACL